MEDKLKIYISEKTDGILKKDAELFEFRRKDQRPNHNAFLNTLILNYFELYRKERADTLRKIRRELAGTGISQGQQAYLSLQLMDVLEKDIRTTGKLNVALSLKPTKKSADVIRYIEAACLEDTTLSRYFRDMFVSYAAMPQDEREKIIFKEQYETIVSAIRQKKQIAFITGKNPDRLYVVSPYSVASAKEELFNYLLASYEDYPYTFRLTRIAKVMISEADAEISPSVLKLLRRMEKYGPQYTIHFNDEEICVKLSERGVSRFGTFYIHRPLPERIEGNLYYFRCSPNQIFQYFCRFGRDAVIIYPKKLQERLRSFYGSGYKAYTEASGEYSE